MPRGKLHNSVAKDSQRAGASSKKSGAGKGNWGRVGDEYDGAPSLLDRNDPNFDPEDEREKTVFLASED